MRQLNKTPIFQELKQLLNRTDFETIVRSKDPSAVLAMHNYIAGRKSVFDFVEGYANWADDIERGNA
jgi:hypothetical protein